MEKEFLENLTPLFKAVYELGGVDWENMVEHTDDYFNPSNGLVPGLIYYADTEPFAKEWHDDIVELMINNDTEEPLKLNDMTWFAWQMMMVELDNYLR